MAQMTKVELIPIDAALAKALETGPEAMEARYGVRVDEDVEDVIREVVAETLALLARAPRKAP
jgi:hypothetical protein